MKIAREPSDMLKKGQPRRTDVAGVEYYDREAETLSRERLNELQFQKLRLMMEKIFASNRFYQQKFREASVELSDIRSIEDLARLPMTEKRELEQDQMKNPLFGTNLTEPEENYVQYHQTTGTTGKPLKFLDTRESWEWRAKVAGYIFKGMGVRKEDRILFTFNFGPYTAFWVLYEGAYRLGALVLPTGGWTSEQRLQMLVDNRATVIPTTPTYAVRLAEAAAREGIDIVNSSVHTLILTGEPGGLDPYVRSKVETLWGARCFDYIGMTEVGTWGFQCTEEPCGVHVIESEFIPEVVDPKTGAPAPDGEIGELVLTNLGRSCMPAVRYRTGDLVKVKNGTCACGRTGRIFDGGVLGRKDEMIVIRAVNVFPSHLLSVVERFIEPGDEYLVEAYKNGDTNEIRIKLELKDETRLEPISHAVQDEVRKKLNLRIEVVKVEKGGIPRSNYKTKRFVDRRKEG